MNRPLAADELKALQTAFPITEPKLTRRQKLLRFADLIENYGGHIGLFHRLEYCTDRQLAACTIQGSALSVVVRDDVFLKDGLKGESVLHVRDYLELTTPELHTFSCDCGGSIRNAEMANRIRNLAGPDPATATPSVGLGAPAVALATVAGLVIGIGLLTLPVLLT